ncbi:hypothetical protein N781_04220 [Pontibacillus halophilus JSM 076056 = DSM 19796]|uniref:Uncharacterized protein n=1 Tax=Pontibacillus halophilus JSM 076056 = DSM 19796 TaxID=1385510 RepID=A0A0A5GJQ7_9BACI|nr:hypothetical protein [Pontibacillus halophilus]KGX91390.1 hypothetical protein N781_04220 [Pontibacillus halophilus JSM 076056 = DSM 19796]
MPNRIKLGIAAFICIGFGITYYLSSDDTQSKNPDLLYANSIDEVEAYYEKTIPRYALMKELKKVQEINKTYSLRNHLQKLHLNKALVYDQDIVLLYHVDLERQAESVKEEDLLHIQSIILDDQPEWHDRQTLFKFIKRNEGIIYNGSYYHAATIPNVLSPNVQYDGKDPFYADINTVTETLQASLEIAYGAGLSEENDNRDTYKVPKASFSLSYHPRDDFIRTVNIDEILHLPSSFPSIYMDKLMLGFRGNIATGSSESLNETLVHMTADLSIKDEEVAFYGYEQNQSRTNQEGTPLLFYSTSFNSTRELLEAETMELHIKELITYDQLNSEMTFTIPTAVVNLSNQSTEAPLPKGHILTTYQDIIFTLQHVAMNDYGVTLYIEMDDSNAEKTIPSDFRKFNFIKNNEQSPPVPMSTTITNEKGEEATASEMKSKQRNNTTVLTLPIDFVKNSEMITVKTMNIPLIHPINETFTVELSNHK